MVLGGVVLFLMSGVPPSRTHETHVWFLVSESRRPPLPLSQLLYIFGGLGCPQARERPATPLLRAPPRQLLYTSPHCLGGSQLLYISPHYLGGDSTRPFTERVLDTTGTVLDAMPDVMQDVESPPRP